MDKPKKRSPKEIIEESDDPKIEHAYIKFPGREIVSVTSRATKDMAELDYEKIRELYEKNQGKKYTQIHTHPYDPAKYSKRKITEASPLPSGSDMALFLKDDNARTMVIAQQNQDTGKVAGYFMLRKTKKTKPIGASPIDTQKDFKERYFSEGMTGGTKKLLQIRKDLRGIKKKTKKYGKVKSLIVLLDDPQLLAEAVDRMAKRYKLQTRFLPAEGYQTDESRTKFVRKGLENKLVLILGGLSFLLSLFFLSSNLTSFTIFNLNQTRSFSIGIVLFLFSLFSIFYFLRKPYK
jgi:hypothetical protein